MMDVLPSCYAALGAHAIAISLLTYCVGQPLTFYVQKSDLERAGPHLEKLKETLGFESLAIDPNIVTLSLVGVGIGRDGRLLPLIYQTLSDHGIHVKKINVQEIKISLMIGYDQMTKALVLLHDALFPLDEQKINS
jgi:aspartate kinase